MLKILQKNPDIAAYCADPLDFIVLEPVLKHLPPLEFIAKNRITYDFLRSKGIHPKTKNYFAKAVIMCRHAAHKFPEEKIVKIGFRHGAYHFKAFAGTKYFNLFDVFFVTSEYEEKLAAEYGIRSAKAIGFPKLDPAFNGTYSLQLLDNLRCKMKLDPVKKTIIFTSTWDKSGMSAIDKWIDSVSLLHHNYNILVTVHPWTSKHYVDKIKSMENIYFIDDPDIIPYLMIADIMVGDTSSIIAEFCALNKPIITFKVAKTKRTLNEIENLLDDISIQIEDSDQLLNALESVLKNPEMKSHLQQKVNEIMFDKLDGKAGERAADVIKTMLKI